MSRVSTTENATVTREFVSPTTTVHWDPISNSGTLVYNVEEMLFINGEFIQSTHKSSVAISLEELVAREYPVEVAPGVVQNVPGGLIMLAFKKAFEIAVEEGKVPVTPVAAPVPDPAPEPAPEPTTDPI